MLDFQAARWLIDRRGSGAGRQRSSDQHSDRRVQDRDGHINIAAAGGKIWERFCEASARRSWSHDPGLRDRRAALEEPRRAQRRDRASITAPSTSADWIEMLQRGRRAVRPDLHDRPDLRRPAGEAPRHRADDRLEARGRCRRCVGQPVTLSRTPSDDRARRRRSAASTPRKCSRSSATTDEAIADACASAAGGRDRMDLDERQSHAIDMIAPSATKMLARKDGASAA